MIPSKLPGESQIDYETRLLVEAKPDLSEWTNYQVRPERPFNVLGTVGGNGDLSVSTGSPLQPDQPQVPGDTSGGPSSSFVEVTIIKNGVNQVWRLFGQQVS